jgi:hypothetical protein
LIRKCFHFIFLSVSLDHHAEDLTNHDDEVVTDLSIEYAWEVFL